MQVFSAAEEYVGPAAKNATQDDKKSLRNHQNQKINYI
jgi:hypothetical protein